jgi:hypothetical protein
MAKFKDAYVKCPHYRWEEGYKQCCKLDEISSVQRSFRDKDTRIAYKRRVCKRNFEVCPLYQALEQKWSDEP